MTNLLCRLFYFQMEIIKFVVVNILFEDVDCSSHNNICANCLRRMRAKVNIFAGFFW